MPHGLNLVSCSLLGALKIKGLTKSGYITKIKKITGSCKQTTGISYVALQNGKQSNVIKMFWFKVEG